MSPSPAVSNVEKTQTSPSPTEDESDFPERVPSERICASQFRVQAGAPQVIRGFRDVFDRYYNRLDDAVCPFGPDDQVDCRCDTLHGTMECDVPRKQVTSSADEGDVLTVKAKIAEFETPPLVIRYNIAPFEDHNVLMRADNEDDVFQPETKGSMHTRFLAKITRERRRKHETKVYSLLHQCIAECIGTMFIVIFGVGSVCAAVLTGTSQGLWQIATVWGFGVALAICATASVSGAHLNPAVSLALAIFRPNDFSFAKLLPYWFAQYLGGVLGGAFNLLLFGPLFRHFEATEKEKAGVVKSFS